MVEERAYLRARPIGSSVIEGRPFAQLKAGPSIAHGIDEGLDAFEPPRPRPQGR